VGGSIPQLGPCLSTGCDLYRFYISLFLGIWTIVLPVWVLGSSLIPGFWKGRGARGRGEDRWFMEGK